MKLKANIFLTKKGEAWIFILFPTIGFIYKKNEKSKTLLLGIQIFLFQAYLKFQWNYIQNL